MGSIFLKQTVKELTEKIAHNIFFKLNELQPSYSNFLNSCDWSFNSFVKFFYEKTFLSWYTQKTLIKFEKKNILVDTHYKTIYEPVRSECSSCRALICDRPSSNPLTVIRNLELRGFINLDIHLFIYLEIPNSRKDELKSGLWMKQKQIF